MKIVRKIPNTVEKKRYIENGPTKSFDGNKNMFIREIRKGNTAIYKRSIIQNNDIPNFPLFVLSN